MQHGPAGVVVVTDRQWSDLARGLLQVPQREDEISGLAVEIDDRAGRSGQPATAVAIVEGSHVRGALLALAVVVEDDDLDALCDTFA